MKSNRLYVCVFTSLLSHIAPISHRVPQCLQYFGVLHYSDKLMSKLRDGVHLPQGSPEEVEIRGCSIWAVEVSPSLDTNDQGFPH